MKNFVLNYERQLVDSCDNNAIHEPLMNKLMKLICEWNERSDGRSSREKEVGWMEWKKWTKWRQLWLAGCGNGGIAFVFLSFPLVGYGRCPRQGLRQREENERKNKRNGAAVWEWNENNAALALPQWSNWWRQLVNEGKRAASCLSGMAHQGRIARGKAKAEFNKTNGNEICFVNEAALAPPPSSFFHSKENLTFFFFIPERNWWN